MVMTNGCIHIYIYKHIYIFFQICVHTHKFLFIHINLKKPKAFVNIKVALHISHAQQVVMING
jgi:hypothetical protein